MAITAKARAKTTLRATTKLEPSAVMDLIKQATGAVKGGGASLLTSGLQNLGAEVHIEQEGEAWLRLSITSGKRVVELCTFSASVVAENGQTKLRVGGLETYKTNQPRLFYVIPTGPKTIAGFSPYKRFLDHLATEVRAKDSKGSVVVSAEA
ncbi:MAG: hypothetical protein ACRDK2_01525 [Solirubrobacteraceae bacterium]